MIPIVPIIMAAATVANTIFQAKANSQNQENFNSQMQYNKDMQDAQNKYNLPTAQRQRYEDAGINPYLALSNITSGSQQSVMSAPQAPVNNPPQLDVPSLVNAITQFQVGMSQAALLRSQTKNQDIKNTYENKLLDAMVKKYLSEKGLNEANEAFTKGPKTNLANNQSDNFAADTVYIKGPKTDLTNAQKDNIIADTAYIKGPKTNLTNAQKDNVVASTDSIKYQLKLDKMYKAKLIQSEISKNYADTFAAMYNAKTNRMNAITARMNVNQQANYIAAQTMESYARYGKVKLETWQAKKMFKYVKTQAIKDIKKRQAEINNLDVNSKKTKIETGFIPLDHGFNYFNSMNKMLNDDINTIGKFSFLLK